MRTCVFKYCSNRITSRIVGTKITAICCFLIDFLFVDNFINDSLFFTFQVSEAIRIFDESAIDHEMYYNYDISVCQKCGNSPYTLYYYYIHYILTKKNHKIAFPELQNMDLYQLACNVRREFTLFFCVNTISIIIYKSNSLEHCFSINLIVLSGKYIKICGLITKVEIIGRFSRK